MQDIKMQTKGKREKRDGPVSELLDHTGCSVLTLLSKTRATACLGTCCNSRPGLYPGHSGVVISSAKPGMGAWSATVWEATKAQPPEEGVVVIPSGKDSLSVLAGVMSGSPTGNGQIGAGEGGYLWDRLSVR